MSVLILGATSPIARSIGAAYAEAGHSVYLGVRDVEEGRRLASDISIRFQVESESGVFDALEFDQHPQFVDEVERRLGPIEVAVVAFGYMGDQDESEHDFDAARRVIDTNYTGAASICEVIARKMAERRSGSIVGIASVAGDRGRKSNYVYGSAKGAFALYLQGLRNRLHDAGVHVMTVKLGFVDTRMTYGMETAIPIADPEAAGAAVFQAERRKQNELYYPRFWRGIMGVIKAIPESLFKRLSL
jgi:short-subunit dehydrogenase